MEHLLYFLNTLVCYCSRHGFLYIRGWMQMVIEPNDLFYWNNKYNKYNVTNIFTHFLLELCTWTHSVHALVLKPWRGRLPWLPAISTFCHVFLFPCLGSTDALCPRLGDPVPPPPRWRPYSQGPRTLPYRDPEQLLNNNSNVISPVQGAQKKLTVFQDKMFLFQFSWMFGKSLL